MSGLKAEMRINVPNLGSSLCKKAGRKRLNPTLLLVLISVISALSFAPPCAAQSGYEIRNAVVTPEYGYEDFTYSAEVWMSEQAASKVGVIAVSKFSLKLNIYDNGELVHSESSDQTGMSKTSFVFGPYSFKDRFGITSTSNATFEYIFYAAGQQAAKSPRIKGPIVQPPTMTGIPSFENKPYFFQGISVSAGFKDLDGLKPDRHATWRSQVRWGRTNQGAGPQLTFPASPRERAHIPALWLRIFPVTEMAEISLSSWSTTISSLIH